MSDNYDFWVLDGTPLAVDPAALDARIARLDSARVAIVLARQSLEDCCTLGWNPAQVIGSRSEAVRYLASLGVDKLDSLLARFDRLVRNLTLTRDLYAEAENTALGAMRIDGSPPATLPGLLFPMPLIPINGGPLDFLFRGLGIYQDWEEIDAIEMQQRLRDLAVRHGYLINPTGVVEDMDGTHHADEIPAARFVASSLLDLAGLDHVFGNIRLDLIGPHGSRTSLAATQDGEVIWQAPGVAEGTPAPPITSLTDINGRIVQMTVQARAAEMGTIEVMRQENASGSVGWTVIVPGTQTWDFPPGNNPQDLLTNIQLVANERNDLMDGIQLALQQLPIAPEDTVTFVGHSQGGDAAIDAAAAPEIGGRYNTTGVVTYGAPTGASASPPEDVAVIHMVNVEDMVPGLAGVANTNRPGQVTVAVDVHGVSGTMFAHVGDPYVMAYDAIAAAAEDPGLAALQSQIAGAANWDGEAEAESYIFQFERTNFADLEVDTMAHIGYGAR